MCIYLHLLKCTYFLPKYSSSFWDVVVVTARDETQKKIYEHQISLKKERQEIPLFAQCVCCVSYYNVISMNC